MPKESLRPRLGASFKDYVRLKARAAALDVGAVVGREHADKWRVLHTRGAVHGEIVSLLNETSAGTLQLGFGLREGEIFVNPNILEPNSESALSIAPEPYIRTPGNPPQGGGVCIIEKDGVSVGEGNFNLTSDFRYDAQGSLDYVEFFFRSPEDKNRWIHSEIGRTLAEMQRRHRGGSKLCSRGLGLAEEGFFRTNFSVAGGELTTQLVRRITGKKGSHDWLNTGTAFPVVPLKISPRKPGDLFEMVRAKVRMLGGDIIE